MTEKWRRKEGEKTGKSTRKKTEKELREHQRAAALTHLAKGKIGKAVGRPTSFGVASTDDPAAMAALRSKYVNRGK